MISLPDLGIYDFVTKKRFVPTVWPLGKIIEVHGGPDDLVRVATVKTATTSLRRHISSLCPQHTEENCKSA